MNWTLKVGQKTFGVQFSFEAPSFLSIVFD